MYVDTGYLAKTYSSKEIYIRAVDTDRTINSAISNLVGMYGQKDTGNTLNQHYPEVADWPDQYVPIPIHTGFRSIDDASIPDAPCRRRSKLWKWVMNSSEMIEYQEDDTVSILQVFLQNMI
ncbi:hypothetical protein OESDEN_05301 [Oesophagostomum dentatum]|uniref:Uncharacterized protein n=1 Tax=Oesophagostomum dentatum TaxID=61180 RepID=A0A0B1TH83_OESDE|nr:hypothetical protein OESDEN_05301 [Oesophagostomum dentatum]